MISYLTEFMIFLYPMALPFLCLVVRTFPCICFILELDSAVYTQRRQWHPTPVLLPRKSHGRRSLVGCCSWGRSSRTRLSDFTFTFHFHALEKEMATHSSVLAWRIPGTEEPGGLPSMGSHRVRHDWSDLAAAACESAFQAVIQVLLLHRMSRIWDLVMSILNS